MRLPWDGNWFKACFYVILTFIIIYLLKLGIDTVVYTLVNMNGIARGLKWTVAKGADIFAPVLIALGVAWLLNPVVSKVEDMVKSRRLACWLVFAIPLPVVTIVLGVTVYRLCLIGDGNMAMGIARAVDGIKLGLNKAEESIDTLADSLGVDFIATCFKELRSFFVLDRALAYSVAGIAVNLALGLVMGFYLLLCERPLDTVRDILRTLCPKGIYNRGSRIFHELDTVFSGYVRGQLVDGLVMSLLISATLWLIRIPFALPIGIFSGFSNIIPYFGSVMGFVLTALSALVSGEPLRCAYAMAALLVLQQIDSAYIVPRVVGKRVEISPFGVIAALTVGGKLFGLWGLVLAVPTVAVVKGILLRRCKKVKNRE